MSTSGMSNAETLEQVDRGYRMPKHHKCPEPIYEMMLKCWETAPESRPTFEFLHSFFDDYGVNTERSYIEA